MKNIANFLFEVGMLKRTPRTGFQFLGSGAESVAEHSFRAAMIGYTLAQMDGHADVGRVLQLCLFHDLPEARMGDLNYVNKKYVIANEDKAVEDLARQLPFGDDYRDTLHEYNAKESLESQLAQDADQIEMVLSLKERKDLGNRNADEWYPFSKLRIKTEIAKQLVDTIWETDSSKWWFDDDQEWWVNGGRE
ncbi:metal dependent phosphohydrolase [Desulfuromusa kysingii]|uniref:5'-deoxynucleotidase n=1 Tax=Desulfuromusa kysingii TaxID=37625 RepID=A0A1H3VHL1_9BACT|nr:HD domain-containing protein [Desulfuromusa kysingii]SDZ73612.1 metal dependent phosphohydrolase [Desulfuromusa kysingii]